MRRRHEILAGMGGPDCHEVVEANASDVFAVRAHMPSGMSPPTGRATALALARGLRLIRGSMY
jgi:hypothetical protein